MHRIPPTNSQHYYASLAHGPIHVMHCSKTSRTINFQSVSLLVHFTASTTASRHLRDNTELMLRLLPWPLLQQPWQQQILPLRLPLPPAASAAVAAAGCWQLRYPASRGRDSAWVQFQLVLWGLHRCRACQLCRVPLTSTPTAQPHSRACDHTLQ